MFDINVGRPAAVDLMNRNAVKNSLDNKIEPNAFYLAIVTNTNDPLKLGRVQIRIPAIHGVKQYQNSFLSDESLPWAKPALFNGAGNDMGQFTVPSKGSRVFVTFEYNNINKPLYFGGFFTRIGQENKLYNDNPDIFFGEEIEIDSNDRITDIDSEAYTILYKTFKGSTIMFNDEDGKESIKIIDAAGQQIILENEDVVALPRRGNKTEPPKTASMKLKTNGNLVLDCGFLDIEAENSNIGKYTGADLNYTYTQGTPSDLWRVTHNLGKYPSVSVIDSAGNLVEGDVQYIDLNSLVIIFSSSFSGKAILN